MKAAVLYESFQPLVVEDLELDAPHEHEVLVKLTASGVCHSDLHYMKGDREHPLPVVLGHEGAGIVEEIGPGVTYAQPGDHVVLSFVPTCGHCSYCVKGRQNLCEARYQLRGKMLDGTTRLRNSAGDVHHFNGLSTFGEYAVVPEDSLVKIREDAPLDRVALIGCGVPTGVGAVINTAKVKPGSSVVVIGAGGVGLNVVQGAVLAGAEAIIAKIKEVVGSRWSDLLARNPGMYEMDDGEHEISALVTEALKDDYSKNAIGDGFKAVFREAVRGRILQEHVRSDGRALDQVRPITCDTGILPQIGRAHV